MKKTEREPWGKSCGVEEDKVAEGVREYSIVDLLR